MLLLLPPSEGKADPPPGPPADLSALAFAEALTATRERVLDAVDPGLRAAPAAPAQDVYTGVLFGRLSLPSLSVGTGREVLIASALWGVVRPGDRIPRYKLPIGERRPDLGPLAARWRPALAEALAGLDAPGALVVDCRSGGYVAMWRPREAARVAVRAFRVDPDGTRRTISHMAKAARGDVARALLAAPRRPRTPADVAEAAARAGLEVELNEDRGGLALDVLER
ncbi:MAG: peroxide stress protein YaaA [Solirubrobacteraceae bacterium]|nr:peroxide stress protein YaaA [Solirubrobacteraceae bacterium]